jgi:hypothetical protein
MSSSSVSGDINELNVVDVGCGLVNVVVGFF